MTTPAAVHPAADIMDATRDILRLVLRRARNRFHVSCAFGSSVAEGLAEVSMTRGVSCIVELKRLVVWFLVERAGLRMLRVMGALEGDSGRLAAVENADAVHCGRALNRHATVVAERTGRARHSIFEGRWCLVCMLM
jgi:hypothetical protein